MDRFSMNLLSPGRLILLSLFLFFPEGSAAPAEKRKIAGQLGMIEGEVRVDSEPARNGRRVREGSVIEVEEGGRATLLLGKGAVFHLAGGTKITVTQYGISRQDGEEAASLDLKFGKTRALILNQGGRRFINIRSKAATMGVRGTEILIDAPRGENQPARFATLEGLADLKIDGGAPPVSVEANRGFSAQGAVASLSPKELGEMKSEIQGQGLAPPAPRTAEAIPVPPRVTGFGGLSETASAGAVPPIRFDPLQDRKLVPSISPVFCDAARGSCF